MRSKTISMLALLAGTCAASMALAQPANTPLGDLAVPGTLSVAGDAVAAATVNWYSFNLLSPVSACDLTWMDIDTTGTNDTEVGLYSSTGVFIGTDDDDGPAALSSLSFGAGSDVTLATGTLSNGRDSRVNNAGLNALNQVLTPGTYYVAAGVFNMTFNATGWSVTSTGGAGTVGLNITTGTLAAPTAPTAIELGTMTANDTRTNSVALAASSVQWYHVTIGGANALAGSFFDGDTETSLFAPTNATRMAVYNRAGRLVTSDTTDGSGSLSQVTYGQTTPARPAVGTGLAYNGRDGTLPPCDYYIAVSGNAGTSGANAFAYTSTDTDTGTAVINLRTGLPVVPPTLSLLSATAAAAGTNTHIAATVTLGANPVSSGITLTCDLSLVGGSTVEPMFDDGLHNDGAAGDRVYGTDYIVPALTPAGTYAVGFNVSDPEGRSSNGNANLVVFTAPTTSFDFGDMSVPNCGTQTFDLAAGEVKWFLFNTGAGGISAGNGNFLDMDTHGTAGCTDTEIGVYRANGTLVASDDDGSSGALSQLSFGTGSGLDVDDAACGLDAPVRTGQAGALPSGTYYVAVGRFNVTYGTTAFGATSTGAAATGVVLNLCSIPPVTPPRGTMTSVPAPIPELATATLRCTVVPGSNPVSTGITVVADASLLGGSATLALLDDGVAPDAVAGDNIFSADVITTVAAGTYAVPFTVSDAELRTTNGTFNATVAAVAGACCNAGSCTIDTAFNCQTAGGVYQGAGTSCGGDSYVFTLGGGSALEDISATGTDISAAPGDDACFQVALSFPFTYYGNVFNSIAACTNGNMQFSAAPSTAFGNVGIPNAATPNNMLAVAWDDFNFNVNTTDSFKHETRGTAGFDLRQIFQWTNVAQFGRTVDTEFNTFQVVLFEDGHIEYRYGNLGDLNFEQLTGAPGVTVGVEDAAGSVLSAQYGNGDNILTSNTQILVAAGTIPGPCGNPCPQDFNQDGDVNPDDLGDYINCYFSIPPCDGADINGDNEVNPDDLGDFINLYFGPPCP